MAKTAFATGHALTQKLWSAAFFQYARFGTYFSKFIGKNERLPKGVDI